MIEVRSCYAGANTESGLQACCFIFLEIQNLEGSIMSFVLNKIKNEKRFCEERSDEAISH